MSDRLTKIVNIAILATIAVLLLNPSGVVGRWVVGQYSERQERRRIADVWDELVDAPSVLGSPGGDPARLIVEFADYDCPACRMVTPTVLELARRGDVTVIVRHLASDRAGASGRAAAHAAICAERQGRFALAHEALMTDDSWLETEDWTGLADSVGVGDLGAFHTCMSHESTEQRLVQDRLFADTLRVPGTPTYVTRGGLHIGAGGFSTAVDLAGETIRRETEDGAVRRLGSRMIFDSAHDLDPTTATLAAASAGFFLPNDRVVVADRTALLFVDLLSQDVWVAGGVGQGPGEFHHVASALRTPEGVAAWDILSQRISFFSGEGEFLRSRTYNPLAFQQLMARPFAVDSRGDILFRDGGHAASTVAGREWDPARYVALQTNGHLRTVATAKGDEMFYRNDSALGVSESEYVIFGHRTFESATEDRVVVAQTDTEAIQILDWSGRDVSSIPMPADTKVAPHQVRMAIAAVAGAREQRLLRASRLLTGQQSSRPLPEAAIPNLPVNGVAPPIDALFVDFDERLWFRRYRLPDQDSVLWEAWDIEQLPRQVLALRTSGNVQLLDVKDEMVLVREVDSLGIPS